MPWSACAAVLRHHLAGRRAAHFQIASKGLWLDEAFSVWLGRQPLGQMLGWLLRIDQHPPLYYTLLHFWMYLGDSAEHGPPALGPARHADHPRDLPLGPAAHGPTGRPAGGADPGPFAVPRALRPRNAHVHAADPERVPGAAGPGLSAHRSRARPGCPSDHNCLPSFARRPWTTSLPAAAFASAEKSRQIWPGWPIYFSVPPPF